MENHKEKVEFPTENRHYTCTFDYKNERIDCIRASGGGVYENFVLSFDKIQDSPFLKPYIKRKMIEHLKQSKKTRLKMLFQDF